MELRRLIIFYRIFCLNVNNTLRNYWSQCLITYIIGCKIFLRISYFMEKIVDDVVDDVVLFQNTFYRGLTVLTPQQFDKKFLLFIKRSIMTMLLSHGHIKQINQNYVQKIVTNVIFFTEDCTVCQMVDTSYKNNVLAMELFPWVYALNYTLQY